MAMLPTALLLLLLAECPHALPVPRPQSSRAALCCPALSLQPARPASLASRGSLPLAIFTSLFRPSLCTPFRPPKGPPVRVFAFVRPSPSARVGPRGSAIRWPLRRAVQTLSILARTPRGSRPLQAPYMWSTRFLASARPACLAVVDRRRPVS